MKNMILLIPVLGFFFACEKAVVVETNFLPGKWNLVKTELFENDSLKGASDNEELSTSYFFYDCENDPESKCEMYIEEDGVTENYAYSYNKMEASISLNMSTTFRIDAMTSSQLKLSRSYGVYKSTYAFIKEE